MRRAGTPIWSCECRGSAVKEAFVFADGAALDFDRLAELSLAETRSSKPASPVYAEPTRCGCSPLERRVGGGGS